MKKNAWILYVIGAVILIGLVSFGIYDYSYASNNYVAKVQNEKITKSEFNFFLSNIKNQMENNAKLTDDKSKKAFWDSIIDDGKNAREVAKDRALSEAKKFKIQYIRAKEKKIELDKNDLAKINSTINDIIQRSGSKADADTQYLNVYGVDLNQYTKILKDLMLAYKYMLDEEKNYKITDDEIKKYYDGNMENKDEVTVRHILISTTDSSRNPLPQDKVDQAKKKADEILAKVVAGGDIEDLAKQYSEDPGSKDNAGQYTLQKGQMVKEFENWAYNSKPGDVGLIKTNYGFHVMKKPTLKELEESIRSNIAQTKYSDDLEKWKNDSKYNLVKNQKVLDSISI